MESTAVEQVELIFFFIFFLLLKQMWKGRRVGWDTRGLLDDFNQQALLVSKHSKGRGGK